jgi:hypothetical protein
MNHSLPVYMRVKRVVVRHEPFERTASGKIALARTKPKRRILFDWRTKLVAFTGFLALAVFLVDFVFDELLPSTMVDGGFLGEMRSCADVAGDVIIAAFAFSLLFKVWSVKRGRRR